ncbi:MAG TPA: tetratricopeptide repeat protein [Candidatus Rifleibacterium sp.]|nr:tetratricopeptide repeat protein [Candidatus Rifleibacterium sp.]HPT46754.1 tetratricopeptide repeat protein [Candidatus Rifleibacterium sp.]
MKQLIARLLTQRQNILLALLFALVATCPAMQAQNLVPALLDQGLRLYAAKDYSGAADYLGQVVDMDTENEQARFYLAYSLAMSGNSEQAIVHARWLVSRKPAEPQYTGLVKQLEGEISKSAQAKQQQQKSNRAVPKEVILGGYQSFGTIHEPVLSTQTRDIAPPKERTRLDIAIEKIDEELYASATEILKEILAKEPQNARALHHLGMIKFNDGKYKEAITDFEAALKADSKSFQSRFLIGDCYRALDDYSKAEEQFRKAIEIKEDVFAMLNLADAIFKQGRVKEADEVYQKILSKDSEVSDAQLGIAQIRLTQGRVEEASEMVNKVIASGGGNPEANYLKAQILLEGKLFNEAVEEAAKAVAASPGSQKFRSLMALCQVRAFNVTKGLEEAGEILREFPDNIDARLVLAEGLIMSGASGDAEEHLNNVEKRMKHPMVPFLRASGALRDGETEKAKEFFAEYLERSPGQPRAAFEYATFLETSNQDADALVAYREISEQYADTAYAAQAVEGIARLDAKKGEAGGEPAKTPAATGKTADKNLRPGKVKF